MKVAVLINLLFLLGLSQAQLDTNGETDPTTQLQSEKSFQEDQGSRKVLRRSARDAITNLGQQVNAALERLIIKNCEDNGEYEIAKKLQPAFDEMKACLAKKKIFLTPKEEYLTFIEGCRRDSTELSKSCLAESQRYFPDFILKLLKSTYNMLYDDYDIIRVDMVGCLPKLGNLRVLMDYQQCLREVATRTHDSARIPDTKEKFCQSFLPTASCFTDMIKDNCDSSAGLTKLREDYINYHKEICKENEIE